MSNKRKTKKGKKAHKPKKRALMVPAEERIRAIDRLDERGETKEAIARCEKLLREFPRYAPLYQRLVFLYSDLDDLMRMLWSALRWTDHAPNSVAAWDSLFGASAEVSFSGLTLLAARRIKLLATDAGQTEFYSEEAIEDLEQWLQEPLEGVRLKREEDVMLIDRGRVLMLCNQLNEAVPCFQQTIQYTPSINNLGMIRFQLGHIEQALEIFRQGVQVNTDNLYAISWIIRLLVWQGEREAAEAYADQLHDATPIRPLYADAQLAGLAFLGRFEDAYRCLQRLDTEEIEEMEDEFFHLAAALAFKQGDKKWARTLWGMSDSNLYRGIEIDPYALLGTIPPEKRIDPPLLNITELLPQPWIERANRLMKEIIGTPGEEELHASVRKFFPSLPDLAYLRMVYECGDDSTLSLISLILMGYATRGMKGARPVLLDLLLSHRTAMEEKMEMINAMKVSGVIQSGEKFPCWSGDQVNELQPQRFLIRYEGYEVGLSDDDMELYGEAMKLIRKLKGAEARAILIPLSEHYPDAQSLRGNIAASWALEGRDRMALEFEKVLADFPDYLFARCQLAEVKIERGEFEEAEQLLHGQLDNREELHVDELIHYYGTTAYLFAVRGEEEQLVKQQFSILDALDLDRDEVKKVRQWRRRIARVGKEKSLSSPLLERIRKMFSPRS